MNWLRKLAAFILAVLAVVALTAGYRATLTPVTLTVDGASRVVRTHQPTVALLLADLNLSLRPEDRLTPALETALHSGLEVRIDRAKPVIIVVDGRERLLYVHQESAADLLALAGVSLDSHDSVRIRPASVTDPPDTRFRIVIERAVQIVLEDGGVRTALYSNAATVGAALYQAGIQLYRADRVYPDPATPLQNGMHIRTERSIPVSVRVDGHVLRTRTHRSRVGEVLADLGVTLNGQDYTTPALDAPLGDGGEIRVYRVTESVVVEQSPIPFDSVWQADPNSEIDTQGLLQEGAPGVLERRIRLRYEDGQVVERWVEGESVVLAPTNRVMGYGTKIIVRQLATESGTVEYWRVIRMLATSYSAGTAGVASSSPYYGRTATGMQMRHGIVAVDPSVIPLRTQVYVPGYGVGYAGDTGGSIRGRRIDLGFDDSNLQLWYRWVDVYLLTPVPNVINYFGP
ncbi:MAG TPA: ubiquitin-like domain-containing protein [Anaerolineae bacterium]|nr:ubiquitin-like domain-containing protein [Anaerolineae bacterium]HQI82987.1 ubiquitin-like domain-containing protein [Anaerolineae bacterium]